MTDGNKRPRSAALQKLLDQFAAALPSRGAELLALAPRSEAVEPEDLAEYTSAVHKLGGSSGSYGFAELSRELRALDTYLHDCINGDQKWSLKEHDKLLAAVKAVLPQST